MRRAPALACRAAPARVAPRSNGMRTAPQVRRAPPTRALTPSIAMRNLATRSAPPPSAGRPMPPSRGPNRDFHGAPPTSEPQGLYTGSDFLRQQDGVPKPQSSGPAVVELSQLNFEELVLKSTVPVIVDCYADWCGTTALYIACCSRGVCAPDEIPRSMQAANAHAGERGACVRRCAQAGQAERRRPSRDCTDAQGGAAANCLRFLPGKGMYRSPVMMSCVGELIPLSPDD